MTQSEISDSMKAIDTNTRDTFCTKCNHLCITLSDLAKHTQTKEHRRRFPSDHIHDPVFSCVECKFYAFDEKTMSKHNKSKAHARKLNGSCSTDAIKDAQQKYRKRKQEEAREARADDLKEMEKLGLEKVRHCTTCGINVRGQKEWDAHCDTSKHLRNERLTDEGLSKCVNIRKCTECDVVCGSVAGYVKHISTSKHEKCVFINKSVDLASNKCNACNINFKSYRSLNSHIKKEHVEKVKKLTISQQERQRNILDFLGILDAIDIGKIHKSSIWKSIQCELTNLGHKGSCTWETIDNFGLTELGTEYRECVKKLSNYEDVKASKEKEFDYLRRPACDLNDELSDYESGSDINSTDSK